MDTLLLFVPAILKKSIGLNWLIIVSAILFLTILLLIRRRHVLKKKAKKCGKEAEVFHEMVELLSSPQRLFTEEELRRLKAQFSPLHKTVNKLNNSRLVSKKLLRQLGLLSYLDEFRQLDQTKRSNNLSHQHLIDEESARMRQTNLLQRENESLTVSCDERDNTIGRLRSQIEEATQELEEKANLARDLEARLDSTASEVSALNRQIQTFRTQYQELENRFSSQTGTLEDARQENVRLNEQYETLSDEKSRYQEELRNKSERIDLLSAQIDAFEDNLRTKEDEITRHRSELSEERQKANDLENQCNAHSEEIQQLKEDKQKLLDEFTTTKEERDALIEKREDLESQIMSLESEKKNLKEQNDRLNYEQRELQRRFDELQAEIDRIQPYMYLVEAKIEEEAKEKAIKEAKEALCLKINEAQEAVETFTHEAPTDHLRSAIANARLCLDEVNSDVEDITNERQVLADALEETSQKEKELIEEERKKVERQKALKDAKESLSLKISEAQEAVETFTQEEPSNRLRSAITNAQRCLSVVNSDAETITSERQSLSNILEETSQKEKELRAEEKAKEEALESLSETIRRAKVFHAGIKYEDIANELRYVISGCEDASENDGSSRTDLQKKKDLLLHAMGVARENIRKNDELESHEVKRSIQEVFDAQEGEIIEAGEFFQRPEHELVLWRRRFEEAIQLKRHRFLCTNCRQDVKISGRKYYRGQISYFSHLHDSDYCEIKTTTGMSLEMINARKYGLVTESERHKRLKGLIKSALTSSKSRQKGIHDVFEEKRVNSTIPYMNWRRPDVVARYNDLDIVFELQLSTTFVSVVVERDIFYRLNNYFIVWVFNFDENKQYVDLRNQMCKDIYYANKRNIFIFDKEAQEESEKRGELVLKCNWLDPDSLWHYSPMKEEGDGILVTLDQLKFDEETCKPYYFDADTPHYEIHPKVRERIQKEELSKKEMLERLMTQEAREAELEIVKREQAIKMMVEKEEHVVPFKDGNRYGFRYNDVILVKPKYSSYSEFGYRDMYKVSFNRHYGLIDKYGNELYECKYLDFHVLENGLIIAEDTVGFHLSAIGCICGRRPHDTIAVKNLSVNVIVLTHNSNQLSIWIMDNGVIFTNINDVNYHFSSLNGDTLIDKGYFADFRFTDDYSALWVQGQETGKWYLYDNDGTTRNDYIYDDISFYEGRTIARRSGFTDIYDKSGICIISTQYTDIKPIDSSYDIVCKNGKYGIINNKYEELLHPEYSRIEMCDSLFVTKQNDTFGLYDNDGNQLLEHLYQSIASVGNGKNLKCQMEDGWFLYCIETREMTPTPFNLIEKMNSNYVKIRKDSCIGLLNYLGENCIPFIYDKVELFSIGYYSISYNDSVFKCTKDDRICAYSVLTKDVVIPEGYDDIEWWYENVFKVRKGHSWGLYDITIGPISNVKYSFIDSYDSDKVKVSYIQDGVTYNGHISPAGKEIYSETIELSDNIFTKLFFGKWGLLDKDNHTIIPFESERKIEDLGHGLFKVTMNDKCGVKNKRNQFVINPIYRDIDSSQQIPYLIVKIIKYNRVRKYTYGRSYHMIDVEYNEYQLFDLDGSQNSIPPKYRDSYISMKFDGDIIWINGYILSPKSFIISNNSYSSCRQFDIEGWHLVVNRYGTGLLDDKMKVILSCEFDSIVIWGNNLLKTKKNKKVGYYTSAEYRYLLYHLDGSPCKLGELTSIGELKDGKATVKKENLSEGYINADGEVLVDKTETLNNEIIVKHYFGAIEVLNLESKILLPITDSVHEIETIVPGYYKLFKKNYGYGLLSVNTPLRIECKYLSINQWASNILVLSFQKEQSSDRQSIFHNDSDGMVRYFQTTAKKESYLYKLLSLNNAKVSQYSYSKVGELTDGKAEAERDSVQGLLNDEGIEVFDIEVPLTERLWKRRTFGLWEVVNEENKQIIPLSFTDISIYDNDKLLALVNIVKKPYSNEKKEYQLFDSAGNKLLDYNFDKIEKCENGSYAVYRSFLCALYDANFNLLSDFGEEFISIKTWHGNMYIAQKKEKNYLTSQSYYWILDEEGKVKSKKYSSIGELIDGKAKVTLDGNTGYINNQCEEIFVTVETRGEWSIKVFFELYTILEGQNVIYDNLYKAAFVNDTLIKIQKESDSGHTIYSIPTKTELPKKYKSIGSMENGVAEAVDENNMCGRIDSEGNELDDIIELRGSVTAKRKFSRYTVYDNDDILLKEIVDVSLWSDKFLKVKKVEKEVQLYDLDTKQYIGQSYDDISELVDGEAKVRKGRSTCKVDENGRIIPDVDIAICSTMRKIKKFGYWYIVDQDYNELTNAVAKEIGSYKGKFISFNDVNYEVLDLKAPKPITVQGEYYDQTTSNLLYSVGGHHVRIQKKLLKLEGKSVSEYINEHKKLDIIICYIQHRTSSYTKRYRTYYFHKTAVYGKPYIEEKSKKEQPLPSVP